jgi:hypothetical protein
MHAPNKKSCPPFAGVPTTACAERGDGDVGEVYRRHSFLSGEYLKQKTY